MSAGESDALHHIHCSGGPERTTAGSGGLLQNSVALPFCGPAAALSGVGCGMILLFPKRAMDREREILLYKSPPGLSHFRVAERGFSESFGSMSEVGPGPSNACRSFPHGDVTNPSVR